MSIASTACIFGCRIGPDWSWRDKNARDENNLKIRSKKSNMENILKSSGIIGCPDKILPSFLYLFTFYAIVRAIQRRLKA